MWCLHQSDCQQLVERWLDNLVLGHRGVGELLECTAWAVECNERSGMAACLTSVHAPVGRLLGF